MDAPSQKDALRCKQKGFIGTYLNVEEVFGENFGSLIDGLAGPIELTTQHLGGDWHAQDITCEFDVSAQVIDIGGTFKDLQQKSRLNSFLPAQ